MAFTRQNALDQPSIAGTHNQSSSLNLPDEAAGLGAILPGQTGTTATISLVSGNIVTLTGGIGFGTNSVGHYITISNASTVSNNGTFLITIFNSSISIGYINVAGHAPDANNGLINWAERSPYNIQDDLNYVRTDRAAIKGTSFTAPIPSYQRSSNVGTNISANLTNIAGNTTDAVAYVQTRSFIGATTSVGNSKTTIVSAGNLKHADAINTVGVPCFDMIPFINNWTSCYVRIIDGVVTGTELSVLSGAHIGERIYGITNNGVSTSPNSVEILFYSFPIIGNIATQSTPYIWESGQPLTLNLNYGYNQSLNALDNNALHLISTAGSLPSGNSGPSAIVPFNFTTTSPLVLQSVTIGQIIYRAEIAINTPFNDPNATLQLGTTTTPNLVFGVTDLNLIVVNQCENDAIVFIPNNDFFILSISSGVSTQGAGIIYYWIK